VANQGTEGTHHLDIFGKDPAMAEELRCLKTVVGC